MPFSLFWPERHNVLLGSYLYTWTLMVLRSSTLLMLAINGFGGGQKGHAPQNAKVALFSLHMQCVINLCSKTNKIYTKYMHFWGVSSPKKRLIPGLRSGDRPLPKKFTFVLNSWIRLWCWHPDAHCTLRGWPLARRQLNDLMLSVVLIFFYLKVSFHQYSDVCLLSRNILHKLVAP